MLENDWNILLGPCDLGPPEQERVLHLVRVIRKERHDRTPHAGSACVECFAFEEVIPKRNRYSWACVAIVPEPKDVADVWIVKVLEDPGHVGPVTWNRKNGWKFETVLSPSVRTYRAEAREDRKKYLNAHKLSNSLRAMMDSDLYSY
jgi:hypothetical protein